MTSLTAFAIDSLQSNLSHQQAVDTSLRLLHYSVKEFFNPQLSFMVHPHSKSSASSSGYKTIIFLTIATLLLGIATLHRLSNELKRMEDSLESHSSILGSEWNNSPEPVTVTTTVFWGTEERYGVPSAPTGAAATSIALSTKTTNVISIAHPTSIDSLPSSPPAPSPHMSETHDISLHRSSPVSSIASQALATIQNMTFPLEWPVLELRSLKPALDKLLQAADIVWQICRKAYHYPLDPS